MAAPLRCHATAGPVYLASGRHIAKPAATLLTHGECCFWVSSKMQHDHHGHGNCLASRQGKSTGADVVPLSWPPAACLPRTS